MRTRVAGAFLAGGLALGSACFLAGTPAAQHATLAWIDRHRPGALDGPGAGPLFLGAYGDDPEGQLDDWRRWLEWTRDAGHRRLRVVGDVSAAPFAGRASFDEVVAYEDRYERSLSTRFSVDTLCLYDARRLSGVEAARIIEVHARRVA